MPASSVCGADTLGENLHSTLGEKVTLPTVDVTGSEFAIPSAVGNPLYDTVNELTNEELTTKTINGSGTFDVLMAAQKAHLKGEYEAGRLTGDQYTKAYVEISATAMTTAMQFLLGKDQAYWQAVLIQNQARQAEIQAIEARLALETAKATLAIAHAQAEKAEGETALIKMELAKADVEYCLASEQLIQSKYTTTSLQPAELAQMTAQTELLNSQKRDTDAAEDLKAYNLANTLPAEKSAIDATTALTNQKTLEAAKLVEIRGEEALQADYTTNTLQPLQNRVGVAEAYSKEYDNEYIAPAKRLMILEQMEAQRAQTLDTRSDDTTPVAGIMKRQIDLYNQQKETYIASDQQKVAKLYTDAWLTQKTIDEALTAPNEMTNDEINHVLASMKLNVGFTPLP